MSAFFCSMCQHLHDADYTGFYAVAGAQMCEEKYDEFCEETEAWLDQCQSS